MKKYLSLLIPLLFISFTSALNLNTFDSQSFRINQGSVSLYPLSIGATNNGEITKQNGLNLILQSSVDFRFDGNSLKTLVVSGSAKTKIDLKGISISPSLLVVHIPVTEDFVLGDLIELSGLNIIVYSRPSGYQNIGVDTNGDGVAESTFMNGVRVLDLAGYQDTTAPNEIFNLSGSLNGSYLSLNWTIPGDIDYQLTKLSLLDSSNNVIRELFKYNETSETLTVSDNVESIKIQSVDFRNNVSTGVVVAISAFKSAVVNTGISIIDITTGSTQSNSTGNSLSNNGISTGLVNETGATNFITGNHTTTVISKYKPSFSEDYLEEFTNKFDIRVDILTLGFPLDKKNNVIIIRNDIIKLLEQYDDGLVTYSYTVNNLKNLVTAFANSIKL